MGVHAGPFSSKVFPRIRGGDMGNYRDYIGIRGLRFFKIRGYSFGGPHNKDSGVWSLYWGPLLSAKLPIKTREV